MAIANTLEGEIFRRRLQKDYADLWGPLSDLLKQLSALVEL